jgi:hypothetical protein
LALLPQDTHRELTRKYGLAFSLKGGKERGTVVIADMDTLASKPPVLKLYRHDVSDYIFEDWASLNTKGVYARYFDPVKKELIEFEYERPKGKVKDGLTDSTLETPDGQGQQERAVVREAMEVFAARSGKSPQVSARELKINLPGNPNLISGVTLELPEDEWGQNAGKWVINESTHTLEAQGGQGQGQGGGSAGYKLTLVLRKQR